MSNQQITIYGTPWCSDCKRALRVLDQHHASYQYINIEVDDSARSYVEQVNRGSQNVPTIVFPMDRSWSSHPPRCWRRSWLG